MTRSTALKRSRESGSTYRRTFECAADAIILIDAETLRIEDVNEAATLLYGFTRRELVGSDVRRLSAEPEATAEALARLKKGEGKVVMRRTHRRRDGSDVPVEIHSSSFASGSRRVIVASMRDLSVQDQTRRALLESEERFREMAENISQVFWMTNPSKSKMLYVSPAYETIWGRSCASLYLAPRSWLEAIHPDDRARVLAGAEAQSRAEFDETYRILRPDGQTRWIRDRAYPIRDAKGTVVRIAGVAKDVTREYEERRKLEATEQQLRQAQKMEAVGRLAGGVAHDFNNILTAILGLAEMGAASLAKGAPLRADLEEIRDCALRAANLTQQLLAFSRKQIISPRVIELDDMVLGLGRMLRRVIGEDVVLRVTPGAKDARVLADPGQLEQLVMNLAVNSRDAMPKGGTLTIATRRARLDAAAAAGLSVAPGDYVVLEVTDDGCGMSEEVRRHVFEPFFTTKEQGKGTGLGLATCYGIVAQNKGAIDCHSVPGEGTRFGIHLPEETRPPEAPSRPSFGAQPRGSESILVVEDEEPVRRLAQRVLGDLGYKVTALPDGRSALQLLRADEARRFRLVITDMVMPIMGGRSLADELAKLRPELPVVFTTGYTDDTIEVPPGLELLRKPFTGCELARRVREVLDRRA